MSPDTTRLNKLIASHLGVGRRQADYLIEQGRVTLNGQVATLGDRATPDDKVVVDRTQLVLAAPPDLTYLVFHKPVGYVCSRRQQGEAPTIYSLLPKKYHHLQPVGRLDKDSSGLLLLTNDGDFALKMTHPSFGKIKEYEITLNQPLEPLHRQMISDHGIELPDGNSKLQLERLHDGNEQAWRVLMHEGRNRQIRRTFEALGYKVTRLHRVVFGTFALGNLLPGKWEEVSRPSQ
ncbi:MAG TPA: pseudouridine synthase [Candidatus Saccharimonadales bacterium]|nr:pseudouridine synthase [Candidatus Saccharimonadales bacterium]